MEVPCDRARVLVAPRHLGDDLRVVAQGCQAAGVQLAEGAQVGPHDVGNLLGKMRSMKLFESGLQSNNYFVKLGWVDLNLEGSTVGRRLLQLPLLPTQAGLGSIPNLSHPNQG